MPQNADLEAQIAKSPDDPANYSVYADWLSERGDPRGELISLQLRHEQVPNDSVLTAGVKALLDQHRGKWLGELADHMKEVEVTWRRGFIDRVVLGSSDHSDMDEDTQRTLYAAIRTLPTASLLRDLVFGAISNDGGEPSWQHATDALVEHGVPASLRRLAYDRGSYWDISWTYLGNIEPAYEQLANLEALRIAMGHMELGTIVLPNLREFEVYTGGFTKANMQSILGATWPTIESLILRFGDSEDYGAECDLDDVVPLLDPPLVRRYEKLRHLAIGNAPFADAIVPLLAKSPLLRQLRSLDLSKGTLSDAGVGDIVRHADAFGHLERIDVSSSYISGDAITSLKKVVKQVDDKDQDAREDYRYCTIGE